MKTVTFGALIGVFGCLAVFLSVSLSLPSWVLFLAWICFYLFGKSIKKTFNLYLQNVMGIGMGILMQVFGMFLSTLIGSFGIYIAIFLFVSSLAFVTKIKGLRDLSAWFVGITIFFGVRPPLAFISIVQLILLPIAIGYAFAYALDTMTTKLLLVKE